MKLNKILLLGVMSVLGACVSDNEFLEEKPKDQITMDNAFNTSDQILTTVLSAYSQLESNYFPEGMGSDAFSYKQLGTDILDGKVSNTHYSNFTTSWSSTMAFVKTVWDNYYKMISYCNLALTQVDNVKWSSEEDKNRVVAEAKFLRALAYLRLAEYFGDVPYVDTFSETARFDYERTPRATVYGSVITDMTDAYNVLPESTIAIGEPGRASRYAAALFLSEAYLAHGVETGETNDFTEAAKYAQFVIDHHPLMTSRFGVRAPGATGSRNGIANEFLEGSAFSDLFVSANMTSAANTEAIWIAMAAPDYNTFAANGSKGKRSITLSLSPSIQDMRLTSDGTSGKPWSENISALYGGEASPYIHGGTGWGQTPPTWFVSCTAWDAEHNFNTVQDDRFTEGVTVRTKYLVTNEKHPLFQQYAGWDELDKSTVNEGSMFCPIFYKETPMDGWDWDLVNTSWTWYFLVPRAALYRNKYIARSGEAYLLLAEAELRGGHTPEALRALNTLRARSNAKPATYIDMQVILDERARELMFEEDRWGTLLRMKAEEWQPRILNYGMYTAGSGDEVYPNIRRWSEYTDRSLKFKNWPIPQTYIDLNTGKPMEQNEGWK